ncbi:lipopolysaccharide biosynthesis protein [Marisediminicola senii]|uniref:lipopolysaccharide biosynthesis protein n=1 Tax=Marisediminicola senii TaxID=2711233 RepID=UPI0013EA6DF0|nr:polysaccharide biosynthesis protein [Marisediminicola senii]
MARTGVGAPGGMWKGVGNTAIIKVFVMGLSGLLGIITSRMILQNFGVEAYAQYGLLASLPALLPFADLGIAAVVLNAIAGSDDPRRDENVRRTITTAFRILLVSGPVIVLVAVVISLLGLWPTLLGNGLIAGGETTALVCAVIFGLALPLTVGQRILVGSSRTVTQIATQTIVAPFILISVSLLVAFGVPAGGYLAVLSYVAAALVSVLCLTIASRIIRPQVGLAVRDIPRLRSVRGVPVIALAGPMLAQMLILPLALQTDRLLLSHLTTGDELAQYNLAFQLFGIALQTITAAGVALWPIYARARAQAEVKSPVGPALVFLAAGLALGGTMALLSPWLVQFVSDGKLRLDLALVLGFVAYVGVQAAKYPLGMYMTDARGLKFQVLPILLMLPVNITLSWSLIGTLGAAGPVIAATISTFLFQVLPCYWYVRRDLRVRRARL